ncbi:response regulator transcription factor [Pendulispora rubella]|uniref:Response regulator transcription factor n=1 Tax=Pendulispora rubella TaxID=2741070 RepID=A0ABZ2L1T9_9BACT
MAESMAALLVEDDFRLAFFTADYLRQHDVSITHVADGEAAVVEATRRSFDVVVLDLMLPKRDGMSVCRVIRNISDVPIVMVTARADEGDRVLGLESGADDYVVKPFSPRELLARMRAIVRRDRGALAPKSRIVRAGPLVLHPARRTATLGEKPLVLTTAEFDLLLAFAQHPARILSRDQLLRLAKGSDSDTFDRAIDVQISRLRQKLAAHPEGESLIRTIRGVGYMLEGGEPSC